MKYRLSYEAVAWTAHTVGSCKLPSREAYTFLSILILDPTYLPPHCFF